MSKPSHLVSQLEFSEDKDITHTRFADMENYREK